MPDDNKRPFVDYYSSARMKRDSRPVIYFYSMINVPSALRFNEDITALAEKIKEEGKGGGIRINFISQGGDTFAGMAMYSTIKEVSQTVAITGINDGMVGSAAILPFLGCSTRLARKHSLFLLHHGTKNIKSNGSKMTEAEMEAETEKLAKVRLIYEDIVVSETDLTVDELKALKEKEAFLMPEDIMKFGLTII